MTEWTRHLSYPDAFRPAADGDDERRHLEALIASLEPHPDDEELEARGPRSFRPTGVRRLIQIAAGLGFIVLGIVGLIFPVMPGWIFVFIGLPIVAASFPRLRRAIDGLLRRRMVQRAIDSAARSETSRAAMIKALQSDLVRRGLDHPTRWMVLNRLIAATGPATTSQEGDDDDR